MASAQLEQLRTVLTKLQSVDIPEQYQVSNDDDNGTIPLVDAETIQRYLKVRDEYLQSRTEELFLKHVSTFDASTQSFQFPPRDDEDRLNQQADEIKLELQETAKTINDVLSDLQSKYQTFVEGKEELKNQIQDLEATACSNNEDEKKDMSIDEDVTADDNVMDVEEEGERALQEARATALNRKKKELQAKLRNIRAQRQQTQSNIENKKRLIQEMCKGKYTSEDDTMEKCTVEEIEQESTNIRQRTQDLRAMSEWYDSVSSAMEELGGIQIINVSKTPLTSATDTNNNVSSNNNNNNKRSPKRSNNMNKAAMYLNVKLMDQHVLSIGLASNKDAVIGNKKNERSNDTNKNNSQQPPESLRVISAEIVTPTIVSFETVEPVDGNSNGTKKGVVQGVISQPSDLVELSLQLGPKEDIRFIIRETLSRIRNITARVEELATLRSFYLTKINNTPIRTSHHGGESQEAVCSINDGVSVVLRMTVDCPLLPGSVYIHQIVGVGGWDTSILEKLKTKVNRMKHRTPTNLMDALVENIQALASEESNNDTGNNASLIPRTPSALPKRKNLKK